MKGKYPVEYFENPNINKPIEEIWADIDAYSGEFFEDEEYRLSTDFMVALPPLQYEGKRTKGIFLTQGTDYIYKLFPNIGEIFFSMGHTMWSSYPWSKNADVYLTCYKNPAREDWYFRTHPEKRDKILIPLQDADFTNEYKLCPQFNTQRDIDILYIGRLTKMKNIPIFVEALKIYQSKYGKKLNAVLITGNKNDNKDKICIEILNEVKNRVGNIEDYVTLIGHVNYVDIPKYYSRAKFTVLTSLIEGKNRTIQESMSCNTPIIVFKDHNKWARGPHELFYENSGLYVNEFSAEALADTFHDGLTNYAGRFQARRCYLKHYGRKNFVNMCIDNIPYFKENLPEYEPGKIQDNLWVDLAMQDNYQLSFDEFLYGKNVMIQHVKCNENNHSLVDFFFSRFGIRNPMK